MLCLKGGVPPLFVSRDQGDILYVLVSADGGPLAPEYFDLAADSIPLGGEAVEWGDLRVLKVK